MPLGQASGFPRADPGGRVTPRGLVSGHETDCATSGFWPMPLGHGRRSGQGAPEARANSKPGSHLRALSVHLGRRAKKTCSIKNVERDDDSKIRQSLSVIAFTAPQRPEKVSKTPRNNDGAGDMSRSLSRAELRICQMVSAFLAVMVFAFFVFNVIDSLVRSVAAGKDCSSTAGHHEFHWPRFCANGPIIAAYRQEGCGGRCRAGRACTSVPFAHESRIGKAA